MDEPIYTVEPLLHWRDLLVLKIPNDNLRRRVETVLDLFEKSAFRYDVLEQGTGIVQARFLSGQDVLARLAAVRDEIKPWLEPHKGGKLETFFSTQPVIQIGKFTITQHDRPFSGNALNGTQTMFVGNPTLGAYPAGFEIGTDYLRGAKYQGDDGKWHPVTVDAAVVHELAHMAYNTSHEDVPIAVEGIVMTALGAAQRVNVHEIAFQKDSNGGFLSLSHKVKSAGPLGAEFAASVRADFATADGGTFDMSQAIGLIDMSRHIK